MFNTNNMMKAYQKKVAAQPSGCSRVKVQLSSSKELQITHNSVNTEREKDIKSKKGVSQRDAFRPCSRVSSGGRTDKETNWKAKIEEKDRFNHQQVNLT